MSTASPSASVVTLDASAAETASEAPWLFSSRVDISLWLLPLLGTGLMALLVWRVGQGDFWKLSWRWMAQYVFGNGTHVILSFLLIGARPEILKTTPNQARLVLGGSLAALLVTSGAYALQQLGHAPRFSLVFSALVVALGTHHTLSQTKGFWALYGLRAQALGAGGTSARERALQRMYVPFGLALVLTRVFAIAEVPGPGGTPFVDIGQAVNGAFAFQWSFLLLAGWVCFGLLLAGALSAGPTSAPKNLYLAGSWTAVALALLAPVWGMSAMLAMHGLEYYVITGRMLQPKSRTESPALRGIRVVPVIFVALLPIIVIGLSDCPLLGVQSLMAKLAQPRVFAWAAVVSNGVVLAHYFADAFLYRFRVPEIRRVMLGRLGF